MGRVPIYISTQHQVHKQNLQAILSKTQQLAYLRFITYTAHISFVTAHAN